MPVYILLCPDCKHEFRSLVLAGTRVPQAWSCSKCGSDDVLPKENAPLTEHPWEAPHVAGCPCCGI